ncbi:MAG TPA: 2-C-methyl-D-erythritol 2,4-cyclodiphosphate synthase [Planctomycetaceae bacterium]|nr:2-C-methyl-D-erythritol 2,4-cyclodiphosphate synthase [Planctomycetaceae bacterium]
MENDYRVGLGHDTHRLVPGTGFLLGGIAISHDRTLYGHSDADVLLHTVTDAVLGAAALGDIGDLFPDTDPVNRGRDSAQMLRTALEEVVRTGWTVVNLDCIVFAQRPKIGPYKDQIRRRIAELLEIAPDRVGIKAKTGEHVGPIGREEAVSCEAIVLLKREIMLAEHR